MAKGLIKYKGKVEKSGNITKEEVTFQRIDSWLLEKQNNDDVEISLSDFLLMRQCPRQGQYLVEKPWFTVKDVAVANEIERGSGGRGITTTTTLACPRGLFDMREELEELKRNGGLFPWIMPLQNYKTSAVMIEESMDNLWDVQNGKLVLVPFRTSAGDELTGTRQRPVLQISFDYNLHMSDFREEYLAQFQDVVNIEPVKIAGRQYRAGCVRISSLGADEVEQEFENNAKLQWWRISVTLQVDPKTWQREYLNTGLMHCPIDFNDKIYPGVWITPPERIWATSRQFPVMDTNGKPAMSEQYDPTTNEVMKDKNGQPQLVPVMETRRYYGSALQMQQKNRENAVEVTEPMMVFPDGFLTSYQAANLPGDNKIGPINLGGVLLPVDPVTGKQYLARLRTDKHKTRRFGPWQPVTVREDGQPVDIPIGNGEQIDNTKLTNRSVVKGYPYPLIGFTKLNLPEHRKIRR